MALVIDIADAVTAELNAAPAGTFSRPFTAARRVQPLFELSELAELKVSVVPKALELSTAGRGIRQHDVQVDVGIQQRLAGEVDDEVPELVGLVEQVVRYLWARPLAAVPAAAWVRAEQQPLYAPEHLLERRLFTGVVTLTYRVLRQP